MQRPLVRDALSNEDSTQEQDRYYIDIKMEILMKNHSTMTTLEFLFSIVWKYAIGYIWYKNLLFRVLPHRDIYYSLHILVVMIFVSVFFFLIVLYRWKNGWTATACFILPFGFYTMMTYKTTSTWFIRIVAIISTLISLVILFLVVTRKVKSTDKNARKRVYRNRISRCIYSISLINAATMLFLMVGIGWKSYVGTGLVSPSVEAGGIIQDNNNEDMIESNRDIVLKLSPEIWEELSTKERIDVLQTVCNIETHYLGLCDAVTVQGDNLSTYTFGTYTDKLRLIQINLNHIENDHVEEVLSTLLHEVYHSCEHRLADLYNSVSPEYRNLWLLRDASYYSREVDNYINPREDYYGYSSQYLEMDSEKYAEFGVKKYYEQIEEWTNERD